MTAAPTSRSSASTTMFRSRLSTSRVSACGASWRNVRCCAPAPSSAPSCSATTIARVSCSPAPCALTSIASASRRERAPLSSPAMTMLSAPLPISPMPASRWRRWSMRGAEARPYARKAAEQAKARYLDGAVIQRVRGGQSVKGVEIKDASGATERIDCDLIAMSGGWSPTIHLTTHLNGKPVWDEALVGAAARQASSRHERRRRCRRQVRPRRLPCRW